MIDFIGRTIRTARPFRTDSTRSSHDRVGKTRQLKVRVSLINNRSMENKHFIGQSKTDGILGVMEADNVRPVVFNLVQEGIRLQFSLRPTGSGVR